MAAAVTTLKVYTFPQGVDNTQRRVKVSGTVSITASPATYTTGGIGNPTTVAWTFTDAVTGQAVLLNTTQAAPIMAYFTSVNGSGYDYAWNKVTNKLQIFTTGTATQTAKAELASGAIPAAVSSDVIEFDADFVKGWSF